MKFPWRKRDRSMQKPAFAVSMLHLSELLQRYKAEYEYVEGLGKHRDEFLTDADFIRLRYIEEQLQERIPNEPQRKATLEFVRQGMDPNNFTDPNYWRTALQKVVRATVHFLHYGMEYPQVPDPPRLYFPGDTFLLWLLSEAKTGTAANFETNIAEALRKAVVEGSILGKPFTQKTASDFGGRVVILICGMYKENLNLLCAIYCNDEDGTKLIEEMVREMHLTPTP